MKLKSIYIISISLTAAIGGFLLGFDGAVISGAIPFYKSVFGLNDGSFLLGFSVSCIIWGSIIGNLAAGPLSDRIGRKNSLIIAAVLFSATGLLCAFAPNIEIFIAGRIIGGLGVGIAILVAPVYIAEIAPAKKRGWLVSFNQLLIVIGLSVAYFSNYFILKIVADPLMNWRWMLGVEIMPAVVYFTTLLFIPESPRWLIMHGKDGRAKDILLKVNEQKEAYREYDQIKDNIVSEKRAGLSLQFKQLFTKNMAPVLTIGFGLGVLQQFSGINAILYYAPMVFESAGGERSAAFMQAIILGLVFVIMTIVSMFLIDRLGRKPLLYIGVGIMALSLTTTGIVFRNADYSVNKSQIVTASESVYKNELWNIVRYKHPELLNFDSCYLSGSNVIFLLKGSVINATALSDKKIIEATNRKNAFVANVSLIQNKVYKNEVSFLTAIKGCFKGAGLNSELYKSYLFKSGIKINSTLVLISILGFIAGFSISLGPVMWALLSEIFPNKIRGFAISVVGAANALASFLVATFFPIQLAKFGSSNTYFIYAGFMFFCLWFTWKYVIETKGKSLEEIEKELITQNELYRESNITGL
jgi:SP family arabinose:H+ symporter-like MFS transporter